jgi:probable HAF family extracellular repeat protein
MYDTAGWHQLDQLPSGTWAEPHAINNSGQVVGQAASSVGLGYVTAVRWTNGTVTDLGTVVPTAGSVIIELRNATGINDSGQILVNGSTNDGVGWVSRPFLLTPVSTKKK